MTYRLNFSSASFLADSCCKIAISLIHFTIVPIAKGCATMELHARVNKIKNKAGSQSARRRSTFGPSYSSLAVGEPNARPFLQAMEAWIEDTGQPSADPPTWKMFGNVLMAARMYE